jgi:putative tryptophan/tyrosine transport system substrate-binding protein
MPVTLKRRELMAALAGAVAWPLSAQAQQPEGMRRVGVLMFSREDDREGQALVSVLRKALEELGWTEGRNIHFECRWSAGETARAKTYAAELVGLAPDVIIANGTLSLAAVRKETTTIPTVFVTVGDPVGQGFVPSLARPGGNITGFTGFEFGISGKWLEILKEIAPDLRRIAFIFHPVAGPFAEKFVQSIEAAAPALGVELIVSPTRDIAELDRVIVKAASEPRGGLIVSPDNFTSANRGLIISLATRYGLPAIYALRYNVVDGGLVSYGLDIDDNYRRAAVYVDRILKGAKPADLPVQNPTKFELVINQKTAKSLGLTIPDKLLARADEVIE